MTAKEMYKEGKKKINTLSYKHYLPSYAEIEKQLRVNEQILYYLPAVVLERAKAQIMEYPVIAITNKRLIYCGVVRALFSHVYTATSIELNAISSIRVDNGFLIYGKIMFETLAHDDFNIQVNNKKMAVRYQREINEAIYNAKEMIEAQKNKPASAASEIRLYKSLLDDGIITLEEFEEKKRQLLGL